MIDEKGRLFGKINIVDLLVILVVIIAAVVLGMKFLEPGGRSITWSILCWWRTFSRQFMRALRPTISPPP